MKKNSLLLILFTCICLVACQAPDDDIYILYDNDVHCAVDGYEKMAALRAEYLEKSMYVNVVSCGDFVQGDTEGSLSEGKYPVALMNAVPYDYVTVGNHEFDYGIPQLKKLKWWLRADMLCCNFSYLPTGKQMFKAYDVRSYGSLKVAFVGVATPSTLTMSTPVNFQNEEGELQYTFHQEDVVQLVQQAVNAAKEEGAQRVIVLSHLGDDTKGCVNSVELLQRTTGIDVLLDGHQHHVLNMKVANAAGDSVLLASTGTKFTHIGCLKISKTNEISNELLDMSVYTGTNARMRSRIEGIKKKVSKKTNQYIGYSEVTLTDSDEQGNRLVRLGETNLGDFVADAMRQMTKADIGVANGGGLRSSLEAGNMTYGDWIRVLPFSNTVCKIEVTGAQIIRALEIGIADYPVESGAVQHVSGLRYVFDASIPSSVYLSPKGFCDSIGETRRIVQVEIEKNGAWLSIDTAAIYTVGGQSYTLVEGGGSGMFLGTKQLAVEPMTDVEAIIAYIHELGDTIRCNEYGQSQNRIINLSK